jgi:hypothetical protein
VIYSIYNPLNKIKLTLATQAIITFLGLKNYRVKSLTSSLLFNIIAALINIIFYQNGNTKKLKEHKLECLSKQGKHFSKIQYINELKAQVIDLNSNFKSLNNLSVIISCNVTTASIIPADNNLGISMFINPAFVDLLNNSAMTKATIAHELGHASQQHISIQFFNLIFSITTATTISSFLKSYIEAPRINHLNSFESITLLHKSMAIQYLVSTASNFLSHIFYSYVIRQLEYMADDAAVQCKIGKELIKILQIMQYFSEDNISFTRSWMSYSPSMENRILRIIEQEKILLSQEKFAYNRETLSHLIDKIMIEQCFESQYCAENYNIHNKSFTDYLKDYLDS